MSKTRYKKGFTLVEALSTIIITSIILASLISIYLTSDKAFQVGKEISLVKESAKTGIYSIEWFFQRWGAGVPCINSNLSNCTRVVQGNDINTYPPPSALYVVVNQSGICDEVYFYASLGGMGFVDSQQTSTTMFVLSCRLTQMTEDNCYHIWRGSRVFTNQTQCNQFTNLPLNFALSGLNSIPSSARRYIECTNTTDRYNAYVNYEAVARNGRVCATVGSTQYLTDKLQLQPGDIIIRVPHRVRFFCSSNPQDQNRLWLYVQTYDMSSCNNNEGPTPIIRVNKFKAQPMENGIFVSMEVLEEVRPGQLKTLYVQRFYGR